MNPGDMILESFLPAFLSGLASHWWLLLIFLAVVLLAIVFQLPLGGKSKGRRKRWRWF
ncbi:MAG: hypothetical protein ACR2P4_10135 [Gammaproteobacteria bacterium]